MTHISKHNLDSKIQSQLFDQFTTMFVVTEEKQLGKILNALFTDSEKIMFIKRLAIILLLREEYSTYAIAKILRVSDSTVREMRTRYTNGKYDSLLGVPRKKTLRKKDFLDTLEIFLQAGLPPRGKGRWKRLFKS